MAMPPAPKPPSLLGYHRILSPTAGVRVSPLCLGTMNFGSKWRMGECTKEKSFEIMDAFYDSGGNFIDTANFYQCEEAEQRVGEWIKARNNRDELVLSTKFTMGYRFGPTQKIKSNFQGNHAKSLRHSVNASLEKLQTDYIDLLYVHMWDFTTSVPELMRSLNDLVSRGVVSYLGISDTPAWLVVKCNEYARAHGMAPFVVYQGHWSCAFRDFERDILPMCEAEGMGIAPWGVVGRGQFRTTEEYKNEAPRSIMMAQDEKHQLVYETLAKLAQKKDTEPTSVAIAYVMNKAPFVFPVVGGRKVENLQANVDALAVELSTEELDEIDDSAPFDIGFPMNFLFETPKQKYRTRMDARDMWQLTCNTRLETVHKTKPIEPRQGENHLG